MRLKSILNTAVAVAALVGGTVIPASATDFGGTATVTVVEGIIISQDTALRFGNIQKPTSGSTDFIINATTGAGTTSGGDGAFVGPASARGKGQYDVNGTDGATYAFSVTDGSCTDAALDLNAMTKNGDDGILDDADVGIGGTLTVQSTVSPGSYSCSYTVTANYGA